MNINVLILLVVFVCLQVDCVAVQGAGPKTAQQDSVQALPTHSDEIETVLDKHFLPVDTLFISSELIEDRDWMYVFPVLKESFVNNGKVLAENFISLKDGKHLWSRYSWKSRSADKKELRVGSFVIYAEKMGSEYYVSPESLIDATNRLWLMARITNVDNIKNGFIAVSGPNMVGIDAVRIIQGN